MSHLGAVVSFKKIRFIHDLTVDFLEEGRRREVNASTSVDDPPPGLYAQALPSLLRELIALRQRYPERRNVYCLIIRTSTIPSGM